MGCEYIKNLILTDYTDASLNILQKKAIVDHTNQCASCKSWAKNSTEITMIKAKEKAPEVVWSRLEAVLDERESQRTVRVWDISGFLERLREIFALKPVMGFAVVLLLTVAAYQSNTGQVIPMMPQAYVAGTVMKESDDIFLSTDLGSEDESLGSAMEMLFA